MTETKWAVDLIDTMGCDDGVQVCETWLEADEFRRSYIELYRHALPGWERFGIIREASPSARLGYHSAAPRLTAPLSGAGLGDTQ